MGIKQKENATDLVVPECDLLAKIPLHGHVGKFLIFSIVTCSFCVFDKHMLNSYCVLSDVLSFGGTTVNRPGKVMSPCLYSTGHLTAGKVGEGRKVGKAHGLDPFQKHIYSSSLYWKYHRGRKDFATFSFFHTELVFNKYPLTQC